VIRLGDLIPISVVLETGEGSAKPFGYNMVYSGHAMKDWEFTSDSGVEYTVTLSIKRKTVSKVKNTVEWYVDFRIEPGSAGDTQMSRYGDTNRGELYRVMATVVAILRDEMGKAGPPDTIRWISDERRTRLYGQYIKRAFPKAATKVSGNEVVMKLKR
jgi:hypothetical protein